MDQPYIHQELLLSEYMNGPIFVLTKNIFYMRVIKTLVRWANGQINMSVHGTHLLLLLLLLFFVVVCSTFVFVFCQSCTGR